MSALLCSPVARLHPDPGAYLPAGTEYFSSLITCNSTSHLLLATGPICSCGWRTHSDVDLHLFSPGISDPWEARCAPLMLVLICLVIWGLLCCGGADSSISCLVSCLMLASVSRGGRRMGKCSGRILGLNPFSARLKSSKAEGRTNDKRKLQDQNAVINLWSNLCCVLLPAEATCLWFVMDITQLTMPPGYTPARK